ncbi:MAG: holo-ACP synthase [Anaerolineales bacterium]|nr:holo-ACP synthase [Anaerolineales bacterium]
MLLSSGIDLIEIKRIQKALERHGDRFLDRIYTEAEIKQARGNAPELAARFAAKEAASKALGTGIGPVSWREMETINDFSGKPQLHLHGRAALIAEELGYTTWSVSLTHSRDTAAAVVVCVGESK